MFFSRDDPDVLDVKISVLDIGRPNQYVPHARHRDGLRWRKRVGLRVVTRLKRRRQLPGCQPSRPPRLLEIDCLRTRQVDRHVRPVRDTNPDLDCVQDVAVVDRSRPFRSDNREVA